MNSFMDLILISATIVPNLVCMVSGSLTNFVCPLFHKRHWTWTITGGFKTQYCSKCDMSWVTRVDNVV